MAAAGAAGAVGGGATLLHDFLLYSTNRYRDVGRLQGLEVQSSVALEKKTRELEAKYGVGHGLRGWFGEQVA